MKTALEEIKRLVLTKDHALATRNFLRKMGERARHGAHHIAVKSTSTGTGARMTSLSKLCSVISQIAFAIVV